MRRKLALVAILVRDYDEALGFYVGTLGFDLVEDTPISGAKRWVVVRAGPGGADILLARATDEAQTAAVGRQGGGRVWLFLHTDDLDRDHARLSGLGVRFADGPRREPYGKVAVFEDLYGNRWDLIEPAPVDQGKA
ncbi:MAG: VOC family protein [Proteobacteria bacterium]|nr:VOC family protein [Pseudomonadota bacterium]